MDIVFQVIAVLLILGAIAGTIARRRAAIAAHPEVSYDSAEPRKEAWRWRLPRVDLGLTVSDSTHASSIDLPTRQKGLDWIVPALGYLAALGWAGGFVAVFYRWWSGDNPGGDMLPVLAIWALLGLLPWAMLNVGSHVRRIELSPDEMRIHVRFGLRLNRTIRRKRNRRMTFSGSYQRAYEMNRDQQAPDYRLNLHAFPLSARLVTRCDQSQGSWLVGGLTAWNRLP